jgi:uncharacterized Zn-finger protein
VPLSPLPLDFNAPEIRIVHAARIACDGGGEALGHPRIYLSLAKSGKVVCPYCGCCYQLGASQSAGQGADHE